MTTTKPFQWFPISQILTKYHSITFLFWQDLGSSDRKLNLCQRKGVL